MCLLTCPTYSVLLSAHCFVKMEIMMTPFLQLICHTYVREFWFKLYLYLFYVHFGVCDLKKKLSLSFIFYLYYVYLFLMNGVCQGKHQYYYCVQCKCFEQNTFSSGNVNLVFKIIFSSLFFPPRRAVHPNEWKRINLHLGKKHFIYCYC